MSNPMISFIVIGFLTTLFGLILSNELIITAGVSLVVSSSIGYREIDRELEKEKIERQRNKTEK